MIWFTYTLQNDYHNKVSYPSLHMITICVCVCVCAENLRPILLATFKDIV